MARAIPPKRLARDISSLADKSLPFLYAFLSDLTILFMPSRHIVSMRGFGLLHTYGSMSCVRASRPVDAVTEGGSESVSSGSITAILGSIRLLLRLTLT
ncbi:MAG: hypothetical protein BWY64_00465 [bacterium ADurb.Bin363]|nr:MAG: hypothetical protein BWY64_00465 [bacterium ADurb.Bin363]